MAAMIGLPDSTAHGGTSGSSADWGCLAAVSNDGTAGGGSKSLPSGTSGSGANWGSLVVQQRWQ
jgi:hypothetical protein